MIAPDFSKIPADLRACPQWVLWRLEPREGQAKLAKVPYDPKTLGRADTTKPETGAAFDIAQSAFQAGGFNGIGLILTGSGLVGVDLDGCVECGVLAPWASEIVGALDSYSELSPSGTGVHTLCRGTLPAGRRKKGPLEMYDTGRFFTVTGNPLEPARGIAARQHAINEVHAAHLGGEAVGDVESGAAGPGNSLTAQEAAELCMTKFVGFKELWEGALPVGVPSRSEAEQSIMNRLAWATGGDPEKMMEAFRESAHYLDKCERTCPNYTIPRAIAACGGRFYQSAQEAFAAIPAVENIISAKPAQGFKLLSIRDILRTPRNEEWLVRGVLPRRGLAQIYGAPKTGKSFVCIDLAARVALGLPWHGHKVQQGPVVYICGEGHRGLRKRFEAWSIFNKQNLEDAPLVVSATSAPLDDPKAAADVQQAISVAAEAWGKQPVLAVVDTVARSMAGDENSSRDMAAFIRSVDQCLGEDTLRLLVHHTGHSAAGRARGSSSLPAALDACFRLEGGQNGVTLNTDFMKDGADPSPMAWLWAEVEVWRGLVDGEEISITSRALEPVGVERVTPKKSPVKEQQAAVLDLLRALEGSQLEPVTVAQIRKESVAKAIYSRTDSVNRALTTLVEAGHIRQSGDFVFTVGAL